jgi:hypothetical protein
MAIRTDFTAGEVLAAADLNDTFGAKLNLAGGKVLQIVRATDATLRQTTSTTFVDVTGMSVSITPQKSDSAILLICSASIESSNSTSDSVFSALAITDSSNNAISGAQGPVFGLDSITGTGTRIFGAQASIFAWATPATTSLVTYKLRFRSLFTANNTTSVRNDQSTGQIFAIEVSA